MPMQELPEQTYLTEDLLRAAACHCGGVAGAAYKFVANQTVQSKPRTSRFIERSPSGVSSLCIGGRSEFRCGTS
jgi:hypothetical protein